jgi:soluble lytic murein transglycosylase
MMKKTYLGLYALLYGLLFSYHGTVHANDLTQQRWQFHEAQAALNKGDLSTFGALSQTLQDYPLYYYLRYQYLKPRLQQADSTEIQTFLMRYGDSHFGNTLRQAWLEQRAQAGDWTAFLQAYTPQKSTELQCYFMQARLYSGAPRQATLEAIKQLWLVGHSQPAACDPAFEFLYQSKFMNRQLVWQRIQLAMDKGKINLTNALSKYLDTTDQVWLTYWQNMHRQPAQTLARLNAPDLPIVRQIILHGIKRLANKNFEQATEHWATYQRRYAFSVQQLGEMQRDLALASLKHDHPHALKWLAAVNKHFLNEKLSDARIKLALKRQNWRAVADFITELPKAQQKDYRWRYWLARALSQLGQTQAAQQLYTALAKERDYYGFLAADQINASYRMQDKPITFTANEQAALMQKTSIRAAKEFYQLGQTANANREWRYITKRLPADQQAIAAALASRWQWYPQAIFTSAKAGYFDDLAVRFPLAYYDHLSMAAKEQGVDLAWAYGIARQESAFMSQARSHAGALGLMQLMPATGRFVARKIGLRLTSTQDILDVDNNVTLGTAYLRRMLDKFDGNYMLATAAYNAGPGRAKRWAEENSCLSPDLWVEMIPFNETRTYVQRVLFYTRIFEERLGKQRPRPLRLALATHERCQLNVGYHETKPSMKKPS